MPRHGLVTDVEQVSAKQGEPVWEIVTDAQNRVASGLNLCAVWILRLDHHRNVLPRPAIGEPVSWDGRHVTWPGHRVDQVDHEFDPADQHLYTG